jgi:hypothetical protein
MEIDMLLVEDVMNILEIDNEWVARCILARMHIVSPINDDDFIAECHRAAGAFWDECANAVQGS